MTEIRSIHGIPQNEMPDRGKTVSAKAPYIPYTMLTTGEMNLALLYDKAEIYAQAYPEVKAFGQAANMYADALAAGVSRGVSFMGALYDPILQQAAANIKAAGRMTRPASGVILNRASLVQGVHIGEAPLYTGDYDHDCVQYATKAANKKFGRSKSWTWWEGILPGPEEKRYWKAQRAICETKVEIERIMNDKMVDTSHHLLYKSVADSFRRVIGTQVLGKKLYHTAGISGLGNVAEISYSMMDNWAEASVMRRNASSGVGTFGSVSSSLSIAPDRDTVIQEYNDFLKRNEKQRGYIQGAGIGFVASVAAITALVAAIGAAVAKAAEFQKQLNAKKLGALATVVGYGTPSLEAKETDFLQGSDDSGNTGGGSDKPNNNLLLIGAAAAGAYFLLND